ncbi:MAG: hypothetical protein LBM67_05230 [Lentimicrobiaceae bacterium]|jgi:hypothetical protein|nr:hypothetical protein [Lentimicrobiaceae bacterium]
MKNVKKIGIAVMLFTAFMFVSLSETMAGPVTVTIYGKGGTSIVVSPNGSTSVKVCPTPSTDVCARLEVEEVGDIIQNAVFTPGDDYDPSLEVYFHDEQKTVKLKLSEVKNYLKNAIDEESEQ